MTKCTNGVRAASGAPDGCLTMFNTAANTVTMLEPYLRRRLPALPPVTGPEQDLHGRRRTGVYLLDRGMLGDRPTVRDRNRHGVGRRLYGCGFRRRQYCLLKSVVSDQRWVA